jgi:hypothetical protein
MAILAQEKALLPGVWRWLFIGLTLILAHGTEL